MINKDILQADMLDILFEHRNKAYGAYALRRTYPQRLLWALASGLALAATLCLIKTSPAGNDDGDAARRPVIAVTPISLPDEKPRLPDQPKSKRKMQTVDETYTSHIRIVDDYIQPKMPDKASIDALMTESKNDAASGEGLGQVSGNAGGTLNETPKNEEGETFAPSQATPNFPEDLMHLHDFYEKIS